MKKYFLLLSYCALYFTHMSGIPKNSWLTMMEQKFTLLKNNLLNIGEITDKDVKEYIDNHYFGKKTQLLSREQLEESVRNILSNQDEKTKMKNGVKNYYKELDNFITDLKQITYNTDKEKDLLKQAQLLRTSLCWKEKKI